MKITKKTILLFLLCAVNSYFASGQAISTHENAIAFREYIINAAPLNQKIIAENVNLNATLHDSTSSANQQRTTTVTIYALDSDSRKNRETGLTLSAISPATNSRLNFEFILQNSYALQMTLSASNTMMTRNITPELLSGGAGWIYRTEIKGLKPGRYQIKLEDITDLMPGYGPGKIRTRKKMLDF